MKKVFLFLVATMMFAANVNAQEVHGVESKMVCTYDCNPNGKWDNWRNGGGYHYYPWFAYEFTNLNSIPVSVEVELYYDKEVKSSTEKNFVLVSTKSFVLKSGESYIFKTSEKGIDYYDNNDYSIKHNHNAYYVKYKAYKLL